MKRPILLDCGDTLIDEGTEVRDADGTLLHGELIAGAAELVAELKARGHPLALVADGRMASFRTLLDPHGLFDLFDAHAISGELGVEKPHERMFRHALDALGVAPGGYARTVMVGNNLERDIRGANALGIVSVWIDWAPRRSKVPSDALEVPMHTIREPLELLQLIDHLSQS